MGVVGDQVSVGARNYPAMYAIQLVAKTPNLIT
jgi:hypothetical protein